MISIEANLTRLKSRIEAIAEIGGNGDCGWTRTAFTPEDMAARELAISFMKEAGLQVRIDAAGNIIGKREGKIPGLPALASGSHIDTVYNGGKFDGVAGVVSAIEAAHVLKEAGAELRHPLEVMVFADEEGARFSRGIFGSAAMVGRFPEEVLYTTADRDNITIAEAMQDIHLDPGRLSEAKRSRGEIAAFIELHIEQGGVLDSIGIPIGIVNGIAGPVWLKARIKGKADHAGATPMNLRKDALVAAAELVVLMERIAKEAGPNTVGTVGQINVSPGGINIIPGEVEMTFDIRDIDKHAREAAIKRISAEIERITSERGLTYRVQELQRVDPVLLDEGIIGALEAVAEESGFRYRKMLSGAGHDSMYVAEIAPVGMIFVPSKDGISHSPFEHTEYEDIQMGATLLTRTITYLDSRV